MKAATSNSPVVHVVEDDPAVLDALCGLLQREGLNTARYSSGDEILASAERLAGGCVVMDVRMPHMDGANTQKWLHRKRPDLPVILITGDADVSQAVDALRAGAFDFLEKPFKPEKLLDSIRGAFREKRTTERRESNQAEAVELIKLLTRREREVLERLVAGDSNKTIAKRFGNSPRTIEIHRARVMSKLSVKSLAEAVRIAIDAGLGEGQD